MANVQATNYLETELLDHVFGKGVRNFTSPATLYVSLHTADPTETGAVGEVSGFGYARQAVTFGAAAASAATNSGALNWTASGGSWGLITHVAIHDAVSAGNALFYGPTTNRTINDGGTYTIAIGDLTASEVGAGTSTYLTNKLLDHVLGEGLRNFTSPANLFVSLHTADPTAAMTVGEVSGNGYSRQAITFAAAVANNTDNNAQIDFTASGGSWGAITYMGIYDASTVGNGLMRAALDTSETIGDGDTLRFNTGDLDVTCD
jgi:hypothetical protein